MASKARFWAGSSSESESEEESSSEEEVVNNQKQTGGKFGMVYESDSGMMSLISPLAHHTLLSLLSSRIR